MTADITITIAGTTLTLAEALTLPRVPWARLVEAGADLEAIEADAGVHGDTEMVRRVRRAMRYHAL